MIESMIFFPDKTFSEKPEDYGFVYEDVSLESDKGICLHGWYLRADQEKGTILFFHGNAGNISHRLFKVKGWIERGFSVFLLDYRSYGKSEGKVTHEQDILNDANAAFNWLHNTKQIPLSKIIFYGESLGTWPAIRLGSEYQVAAVILEAPFTSFVDLAHVHYPMVPGMFLKNFAFHNLEYVANLKAPIFILHGTDDEICPFMMGQKLFEKAPQPKEFYAIPGGHHNDLPMIAADSFWQKPAQFLEKIF